jgi:hypothetical protein
LYTEAASSFITTAAHAGKVTITNSDTINEIVSGTFKFTAVNSKGKTVKPTDGRFDIITP